MTAHHEDPFGNAVGEDRRIEPGQQHLANLQRFRRDEAVAGEQLQQFLEVKGAEQIEWRGDQDTPAQGVAQQIAQRRAIPARPGLPGGR